jgi:hypothetical protein
VIAGTDQRSPVRDYNRPYQHSGDWGQRGEKEELDELHRLIATDVAKALSKWLSC